MSDSQQPNDEASPDSFPLISEKEAGDTILAILVRTVNQVSAVEIPVTLQVGGVLVSGYLCSAKTYIAGLTDGLAAMRDNANENIGEAIAAPLRAFGEQLPPGLPVGFVHLRNAQIFGLGQSPIPNDKGIWWRGRLCQVDAFFIGALSAS